MLEDTFDEDIGAVYGKCCSSIYIFISGPFRRSVVCSFKEDVSLELQGRSLYLEEKDNEELSTEKYRIGPVVDEQY